MKTEAGAKKRWHIFIKKNSQRAESSQGFATMSDKLSYDGAIDADIWASWPGEKTVVQRI